MVTRVTPILGPGLEDYATSFWFLPAQTNTNDGPAVSYPLGTMVKGQDGRDYVMVVCDQSGGVEAEDGLAINSSWQAVDDSTSPEWEVPPGVVGTIPQGAYFHARRTII